MTRPPTPRNRPTSPTRDKSPDRAALQAGTQLQARVERVPELLLQALDLRVDQGREVAVAGQLVWMYAEEVAAYLNYPKATFDGLAGRGEVPRHKRGAGWR